MPFILRNPHSVLAVLDVRPQDVLSVSIPPKASTQTWQRVADLAKKHGIQVQSKVERVAKVEIRAKAGGAFREKRAAGVPDESLRMGFAEAEIRERAPISPEKLFEGARERRHGKGLWIALDQLTDPHNVGAIFRAAAFFGVEGILMTADRSAPMTATVYDVASGGVEYVPYSVHTNLQRGFEIAKEAGVWVLGTSEHASENLKAIQTDRPWLLVLGNEEKGMRRLTQDACDLVCRISGEGRVTSLNVSVAAGILISHLSAH